MPELTNCYNPIWSGAVCELTPAGRSVYWGILTLLVFGPIVWWHYPRFIP